MRYFVHINGVTFGPLTEAEVRDQLISGELLSFNQVCKEGGGEWIHLNEMFENLEYKLPPPPEVLSKENEKVAIQRAENEPLFLPISGEKLQRSLRPLYDAGIAPALKIAAPVAAVGGFVSDVLQPIGPFSFYLFLLSVLVAVGTGIWMWNRRRIDYISCGPTCSRICYFAAVSSVILGVTWIFFTSTKPEEGFLASKIPAVEELQKSVWGVKKSVERMESTVIQVSTDVTEIKTDVKDISKGVTSIGKMGGIITNPTTPVELYNNALIYKERGDASSQRDVLESFVGMGVQKIEPYEMLIEVIKGMEGLDGARKAYETLIKKYPDNLMLRAYFYRLLSEEDRLPYLRGIIAAYPNFTPAYYPILGGKSGPGELIDDIGSALDDATMRMRAESKIGGYTRWSVGIRNTEESREHYAQALHEEFKKRGIDPNKDDNYSRKTIPDFNARQKDAEKAAEIREKIRLTESQQNFSRVVKKPSFDKLSAEIDKQMLAALEKNDFSKIYTTYLGVIQEQPLRKFVYDTENAYYAAFPEQYYNESVTSRLKSFDRDKEKMLKQFNEQIRRSQLELDELKSELEVMNENLK